MNVHDKRRKLFDKITRAKQLNQSQCDQMKNLNIRSEIISRVVNEGTKIIHESRLIKLNDSFKCKWYGYYKFHAESELQKMNRDNFVKYIKMMNHVKQRSKYISKLRQEMLKYKCKGF